MRCRVEQCYGLRRVAQELNQKGIDSELAKRLLEESELDWFVLAADCFKRKYRRQYNPDDSKSKERCLRSMSARGFPLDEIYHAIDQDEPQFY
ncbi:MAG: recombination regulator RecX [Pseudomonadales bacterium]|nr:recombination regulator RecX [Pseudomonadales bacterium]NRA16856.1 regulatory protein RecX [Oceanospirillaceae bacterium]